MNSTAKNGRALPRAGDALPRANLALPWALVTPALGWTLLFFVLPFIAMGISSLTAHEGGGFTRANYSQFFTDPSYWQAMVNSLEVTAIVTVVSVLLAYPFAWILAEQVPERWQRLALMLAVLPFWTSYVVRSYSWLLVLAQNGVINRALTGAGLITEPLQLANIRLATVTGFVHFFVMLLTLTIFANLKQLSPSYRKAAADLGAGPVRTFLHVVLPLTLPGIMVGAFLTFVLCIGDYITPQILGGNNELLMPQLVMMQIGRRGDFPLASALSIILMAVVTVAYLACARWLKIERA
ncbi:ABC transporter permease [Mesorhizobium opportunistum]|uniref:ABC transporter permease n=1 Tax=Mesorhizobium opportunistum TaxID=593909 RepID=UPI00333D18B0